MDSNGTKVTCESISFTPHLCFFAFSTPVFESFKDYVATEQLDGDNKYDAGEHGLQVRAFVSPLIFY